MGKLIDSQVAIEMLCSKCTVDKPETCSTIQKGDNWCEEVYILQRVPSAQPEQQWIPCSERLPDHPENDDYYLVTIQCEHYDGWDDYVTGFAEWTKQGWDELSCYIGQIKVVAWMPLPEPYAERRTDG